MVLRRESSHGSPMKQRTLSTAPQKTAGAAQGAVQDDATLYYESTMALARMLRVGNLTTSVFERMTGVHIAQWRILAFLAHNPDCTQKQLKDAHQVDPAAITRSVKLLERSKLVVRRTDADDNRLTRVILTAAGEKLVAEVSERRRRYLREALQGIAPKDIDVFEKVLVSLEANTQKMADVQGEAPREQPAVKSK